MTCSFSAIDGPLSPIRKPKRPEGNLIKRFLCLEKMESTSTGPKATEEARIKKTRRMEFAGAWHTVRDADRRAKAV